MSAAAAAVTVLLCLVSCSVAVSASAVTLLGGGSSLAAPLYASSILAYALQEPTVSISYASSSSGTGRADMLAGLYDFADSDSILPASFWAAQPDSLCLPVLAAAVVPIFNVPQLSSLQLTQSALALIFMGNITRWNDAAIAVSNAGLQLPDAPISVVVRSDSSGTTHIFTAALSAFYAPFNATVGSAELVHWPVAAGSLFSASGNTGVANLVASMPYAIGYSVLNEAVYRQITFAAVQNTAGAFVLGSPAAVQYALYERAVLTLGLNTSDILPGPSGNSISLVNPAAPRAYPISGFSYLLVFTNSTRTNQTCAARSALVQFMLFMLYSSVVSTIAAQSEFNSLPALLQQALNMQQVITSTLRCPDGSLAYTAPAASDAIISGSGALAVQSFLSFFTAAYASVNSASTFEYAASSSEQALQQMADSGQQPDVASFAAVMDAQLSASDLQLVASSSSPALQLLPVALLPVIPVFNLPGLTSLNLSVAALGSIYSGGILQWDDAAIAALNPAVSLPSLPIILTAVSSQDSQTGAAPLEATSVFVNALFRLSPAFAACYVNNASSHNRQFDFSSSVQAGCSAASSSRWLRVASEGSLQSVVVNTVGAIGFTTTGFSVQAATVRIAPNASAPALSFSISQLDACLSDGGYSADAVTNAVSVTPALSSSPHCWPFVSVLSLLVASSYSASAADSNAGENDSTACSQAAQLMAFAQYLYSPAAIAVLTSAANTAGLQLIAASSSPVTTVSADITAYISGSWSCDGSLMIVTPPAPVVWQLSPGIRGAGDALAALGFGCTLAAMLFLWQRRRHTVFRLASPMFVFLSLLGLLCLFVALLLVVQPVSAGACSAFNWMVNLGFTLTLSPLLVKAWRIYRIFNRRKMRVVKLTNGLLLQMVAALLAVELTVLVVWQALAPMAPNTTSQSETSGLHVYTQCAYTGASVGFFTYSAVSKCLMLALGVLLAFSSREVAEQFNESKSIAMSVYNIVVVLAVIGPIIAFISAVGDALIALLVFLLSWASFFTLATLMLPKILSLRRSRAAVADGVGSLNHTLPNEQSLTDGEAAGGLFSFPSLDGLLARPTLLQYIGALEKQHRLAKHKLRGLSKDEQQAVDTADAVKASDAPPSTVSPPSVVRTNTLLSPQPSRIRATSPPAAVIPTEVNVFAVTAVRPAPVLLTKASRTTSPPVTSPPATPNGKRAQTGWMDKPVVQ